MPSFSELREQIRAVLVNGVSSDPAAVEDALDRIMAAVDPLEKLAQEELNRFRSTFADLAR